MRAIRRFTVRPVLPKPLEPLEELATNLRWFWHRETQELFTSTDPDAWHASGHDPVRLLGMVPQERLQALSEDRRFLKRLEFARADLEEYLTGDRWYQGLGGDAPRQIAYFSPEFGVAAVLPQYSGGLGVLAGDHLKTASDLGVPLVGVGLLYRHGYFHQSLSREGWQQERYPIVDPDELPLRLLRTEDGSPVRVQVGMPGGHVMEASVWEARVGRVPLLLLDSDVEGNPPHLREVTDRLYGGGSEHRFLQEVLLGVGGVRALRAYCRLRGLPAPEVYHSNEGHAGFLGIERIREFMATGLDFGAALEKARPATIFTTHTPVPAGIDRFPRELVAAQFGGDNADEQLPVERILELGAETYPGGDDTVFNMAVMGLRLAGRANGVSELHGQVSRRMFAGLWPGFEEADIPITSVTNGVHGPTWVSPHVLQLAQQGAIVDEIEDEIHWEAVDNLTGDQIWATKRLLRSELVDEVRRRVRDSWLARGASPAELGWVDTVFDPDVLTIGFARRVPSYKRLTLMLRNPDRLTALLLDRRHPVQIVVAGKAHPMDEQGKKLIQEIVRFCDDKAVRHRIAFLPNYDIAMAQTLYPGCDVWLNNPLRPYEACGTSGMKAALNGGLNLSILDGWWDEWYDGDNGWAIPSADGVEDPEHRDTVEADALYDLIEKEVAPRFYDTNGDGIPVRWVEMVTHTLQSLGPKVLASRMVRDYVHRLYTPAAVLAREVEAGSHATELAEWKHRVRASWPEVRIEHVESKSVGDSPELGSALTVLVYASLGGLGPDDVDVQVLHGRVGGDDQLRDPSVASVVGVEPYDDGRYRFEAEVPLDQPGPIGYTARVCPRNALLASPAELGVVCWPPEVRPAPVDPEHEAAAESDG
ncbi:MAG TPA: alpha-glucan family phosphorylase [Nocardioidaceae bacterium]|nr:alpha-glucan family phosphorylase [Nocardioidaceae bacterium]